MIWHSVISVACHLVACMLIPDLDMIKITVCVYRIESLRNTESKLEWQNIALQRIMAFLNFPYPPFPPCLWCSSTVDYSFLKKNQTLVEFFYWPDLGMGAGGVNSNGGGLCTFGVRFRNSLNLKWINGSKWNSISNEGILIKQSAWKSMLGLKNLQRHLLFG